MQRFAGGKATIRPSLWMDKFKCSMAAPTIHERVTHSWVVEDRVEQNWIGSGFNKNSIYQFAK